MNPRRTRDRLATEGRAVARSRQWREDRRRDIAEGITDYRRNGR